MRRLESTAPSEIAEWSASSERGELAMMRLCAAVVFAAVTATGAFAQSSTGLQGEWDSPLGKVKVGGAHASTGPSVGGNFNSRVDVGDVSAEADGEDSRAVNQIGSMSDGAVGGNVDTRVQAKDVTATATKGGCAENQIGSIGHKTC